MSHLVTIAVQIRDLTALQQACSQLKLPPPQEGEHRVFTQTVRGWGVQLRQWRYPVVCDLPQGRLHYDDFNGCWGDRNRLSELLQHYSIAKTRLEARRHGYHVRQQALADGRVQLSLVPGVPS